MIYSTVLIASMLALASARVFTEDEPSQKYMWEVLTISIANYFSFYSFSNSSLNFIYVFQTKKCFLGNYFQYRASNATTTNRMPLMTKTDFASVISWPIWRLLIWETRPKFWKAVKLFTALLAFLTFRKKNSSQKCWNQIAGE